MSAPKGFTPNYAPLDTEEPAPGSLWTLPPDSASSYRYQFRFLRTTKTYMGGYQAYLLESVHDPSFALNITVGTFHKVAKPYREPVTVSMDFIIDHGACKEGLRKGVRILRRLGLDSDDDLNLEKLFLDGMIDHGDLYWVLYEKGLIYDVDKRYINKELLAIARGDSV